MYVYIVLTGGWLAIIINHDLVGAIHVRFDPGVPDNDRMFSVAGVT